MIDNLNIGGTCKKCFKFDAFLNFKDLANKIGYKEAKIKTENLLIKYKCTCTNFMVKL